MGVLHIRDFPDELQRRAKAAAALRGETLKAFVARAVERECEEAEAK